MPAQARRPRGQTAASLASAGSQHFAASTNDVATVLALIAGADAVVPSTDVAVVSAWRERAGRTRVPAATQTFELVHRFFAAVAAQAAAQRGPRPGRARARRVSG